MDTNHREEICCPKCGCTQFVIHKKGFGLGKALMGGAIFGGIGLLAGFVGSKKIKLTCLKCRHSWTV